MQYQIPQFLEIEDKIFGPLTLKQFLYTAAGAAIMYLAWANLPQILAVIIGGPFLILFLGLAFYKVNNRPLSKTIEFALTYFTKPKLYIWKKREKTPKKIEVIRHVSDMEVPSLSESKLRNLSWGLDIYETLDTLEEMKITK
jgi:hypothetical protein